MTSITDLQQAYSDALLDRIHSENQLQDARHREDQALDAWQQAVTVAENDRYYSSPYQPLCPGCSKPVPDTLEPVDGYQLWHKDCDPTRSADES